MVNVIPVAVLVACGLLAGVTGYTVQGPCPADENGQVYQPGDRWLDGCYMCDCWVGGFGCNQWFPTCTYPAGCVKVYNENGCEVMAVMENQADQVCDPLSCYAVGK